jgi:hypothetical protein
MSQRVLKPIGQHCYDLAEAMGTIEPYDSMLVVSEWLRVAAAIKNVDVDWIRFDTSFGWCSGADNHNLAKEQILQRFVTNLTVFMYTWGAVEAAIDTIIGKTKRRKVIRACHYVSTYFRKHLMIAPYPELVSQFCVLASKSPSYGELVGKIKSRTAVEPEGFGLFVVYKLRNEFAHGDMVFPEPDNEHRPISNDPSLIECATRIALLSVQMLALVYCADKGFKIERPLSKDNSEIPLTEWLRVLHYKITEVSDDLFSSAEEHSD